MTTSSSQRRAPTASPAPAVKQEAATPAFDSRSLFGDANEIIIRHEQATYRLRITRQRKLILNK